MEISAFRATFPSFGDEQLVPDTQVSFWLNFAEQQCPAERWGSLRETGTSLLAAHHLTLLCAAGKSATGGMDAAQGGVVAESKAVGGMSVSRSRAGAAATGDVRAGHYNDTIYGKQYFALAMTIGVGALVL